MAEPPATYDASDAAPEPTLARLATVAQETSQLDLDALTDEQLRRCLSELRRPLAMLEATRSRLLASLEARAARRVRPGGSVRGARDEERRKVAQDQRMSRSRAKREAEAGHAAEKHRATGAAFTQGDIGPEHASLIADLLTHVPADQQAAVEGRLLALAREHEPVGFGRSARALLHEIAPDRTAEAEQRKESRRELRMADTPDGSLVLSGQLHGTSAELARVALDAFKRFDAPDAPRTVEQRNADAFLQLCEVALKAEQAPMQHGARPHVLVVVRAEDLDGGAGPARFGHSGQPVNLMQARRLFSDCIVSRIAVAADGTPIEASANVRTVPAGLHRALVARDRGCTWHGCDAPPSWCDVAHGNVPFRANEPLHLGDAALLCRRHHRRFDHGRYRMVIEGDQVSYLRLAADGRPLGEQAAPSLPPPGAPPGSAGTSSWQPFLTPGSETTTTGDDPPSAPASERDRPVRGPTGRRPSDAPPPDR
ncbi:MAG: DUF222 domain-containing protein [Actinomycetota bacterium]